MDSTFFDTREKNRHRECGNWKKIHTIRKIAEDLGKPVAILQDLGGPKIRVGHML
jgi:pyruvate kinase